MKVLIIGLGSIAEKHIKVLRELDSDIHIFALRSNKSGDEKFGIHHIYSWTQVPDDLDFIIISNPTSMHAETIFECIKFEVPLFIEKPVLQTLKKADEIIEIINMKEIITYVACNLRYHPAIQFLKREFSKKIPIEYNSYCGTYLPDWRPHNDYREIYSSHRELGGGVHLDLIHEIDFCTYLLGNPINKIRYISRKSKLEINSVDIAHYIFEFEQTSAFITLNYYRRDSKREIVCVWDDDTWNIDLLKNKIVNKNSETIYYEHFDIMDTYTSQMKKFIQNVRSKKMPDNNIEAGIKTLKLALNE